MKYKLQPESVILDNNGITTIAGWTVVYNVDANTGEFLSATYQYLPVGVGLPAFSYIDAPKSVNNEKAIVRQGNKWSYPNDYRGQKIYSTETGVESIMQNIGEIPNNYTMLKPESEFDVWDGKNWRLDHDKKHQYEVKKTTIRKNQLIDEATNQISYLQDAVDSQIATELEIISLAEWKKYRVLLNRINTDLAPDITFPEKPNK
ncbi:tail fiber assembly protein [Gilliamella sp. CG13]|uniref:tail fiber assembly protein n=1 Tax=Gilliamella sp. CG13 TaxID=3351502 RepID=UPI003988298E